MGANISADLSQDLEITQITRPSGAGRNLAAENLRNLRNPAKSVIKKSPIKIDRADSFLLLSP